MRRGAASGDAAPHERLPLRRPARSALLRRRADAAHEPRRPLVGLGVRRLEAGEHVLEDRVLHPHRAVEHADELHGSRRQGVLLLDRRQRLRDLRDREHEALDLLQRGRAHLRPRDPPAQRRARVPLLRGPAVAALQARDVERLRRADDAHAELPHAGRRPDVAGDAGARDGREPARHRLPALPQRDDRRQDGRGRAHRHVRQSRLRTSRPARGGPGDLRRGVPGRPGPRHPAPRLADLPRQPRRGRLPADELDVRERGGSAIRATTRSSRPAGSHRR